MKRQRRTHRWVWTVGAAALLSSAAPSHVVAQAPASPEVRATLEGTWELVEWHHEGEVLRPPEIGGIWSNHDGVVLVNLHRFADGSFQQTASYGTYQMDATTWSYRYDRRLSATGISPEDATVTVTTGLEERSFTITRDGDTVFLDRPHDHREYDGRYFRFMPEGQILRVWRKVE